MKCIDIISSKNIDFLFIKQKKFVISEKFIMYSSPKSEISDDLTFLRGMIEQPSSPSESIDYQFLQKELNKRRPQPVKPKKGIETIEPQTKPPTRKPNYLKSPFSYAQSKSSLGTLPKSNMREITYTFPNDNDELEAATNVEADNISNFSNPHSRTSQTKSRQYDLQITTNSTIATVEKSIPKQPKSYLSWKFIGDTKDGNFGILTGKINARETPTTLKRNFANIPYVLDQYHIEFSPEEQEAPPKIHPRDLFALSIAKNKSNEKNSRTISRLQQQKLKRKYSNEYQNESDTQIYLETDEKLIPLVASRLPKGTQV